MKPQSPDQITAVDAEGTVSFTVPETTHTVSIAELEQNVSDLQEEHDQQAAVLANIDEHLATAQDILAAATPLQEAAAAQVAPAVVVTP